MVFYIKYIFLFSIKTDEQETKYLTVVIVGATFGIILGIIALCILRKMCKKKHVNKVESVDVSTIFEQHDFKKSSHSDFILFSSHNVGMTRDSPFATRYCLTFLSLPSKIHNLELMCFLAGQ